MDEHWGLVTHYLALMANYWAVVTHYWAFMAHYWVSWVTFGHSWVTTGKSWVTTRHSWAIWSTHTSSCTLQMNQWLHALKGIIAHSHEPCGREARRTTLGN